MDPEGVSPYAGVDALLDAAVVTFVCVDVLLFVV